MYGLLALKDENLGLKTVKQVYLHTVTCVRQSRCQLTCGDAALTFVELDDGGGIRASATCDWTTGAWIMQAQGARSEIPSWMGRSRSVFLQRKTAGTEAKRPITVRTNKPGSESQVFLLQLSKVCPFFSLRRRFRMTRVSMLLM